VAGLVESGGLHPLPFRAFPAARVDAAFRLMAQGRHTGKIVVSFAQPFLPRRGRPLAQPFVVRSDARYLVTGGLGGFGRVIARWLADQGARHLVLCGRSGAASPEAEAFVTELRGRGVDIEIHQADAGSGEDVSRVVSAIENSGPPLRGIFHLAMVIDDAPMGVLTADRLRKVMAPKAHGAWLLHERTRHIPLDCFVMFSSVSSIFGNPAQANYAAANAVLDSLALHRRALGLSALAINWGVLGG
jgi:NADPH:quinone reductase-like Zn-dependent oxidoreductase